MHEDEVSKQQEDGVHAGVGHREALLRSEFYPQTLGQVVVPQVVAEVLVAGVWDEPARACGGHSWTCTREGERVRNHRGKNRCVVYILSR